MFKELDSYRRESIEKLENLKNDAENFMENKRIELESIDKMPSDVLIRLEREILQKQLEFNLINDTMNIKFKEISHEDVSLGTLIKNLVPSIETKKFNEKEEKVLEEIYTLSKDNA